MATYSVFSFDTYDFSPHSGKISLRYSLDRSVSFTETLILPTDGFDMEKVDHEALDRALFALHLIGGISYYKTYCPKTIKIHSGKLTKPEALFWNSVYENGLGEFFFKNDLDFRGLINFPFEDLRRNATLNRKERTKSHSPKRVLVPIGGGKDSLVTVELLKKQQAQCMLFRVEEHPIIDELAHIAGLPMLTVKRMLAPELFELNTKGALNGHIPITAYLSMLSVVMAILFDFDSVVMSNEQSASEGNVRFKSMQINHQWSKSLNAERAIRSYIQGSIDPKLEYFSLIRPLTELHVTKIFSNYTQYFGHFTSCNKNWKILATESPDSRRFASLQGTKQDQLGQSGGAMKRLSEAKSASWCGTCPKCAFVFCLLAAFLPVKTVEKIFGRNLYEDKALLPLYRELLGLTGHKPFECVGTPEETKAAFLLARKRGDMKNTAAMGMFESEILESIGDPDALIASQFVLSSQHFVPQEFTHLLA